MGSLRDLSIGKLLDLYPLVIKDRKPQEQLAHGVLSSAWGAQRLRLKARNGHTHSKMQRMLRICPPG